MRALPTLLASGTIGLAALVIVLEAPPAAAELRVSGEVLGPDGAGLAGARVELHRLASGYEAARLLLEDRPAPRAAVAATTGTDGRFRLDIPESGLWKVLVQAAGFVAVEAQPLALTSPVELAPVALSPDDGARLRIVGPTGRPLAGLRVRAVSSTEGIRRPTADRGWRLAVRAGRTGEDGRLVLPRGRTERLTVSAFDPELSGRTWPEVEGGELRFEGARPVPRQVEVRGPAGEPQAGILVRIGDWPAGLTGHDGRLAVPARPGAPADVLLLAPDGRRQWERLPPDADGRQVRGVTLAASTWLTGRVAEAGSRRPMAGALVWPGLEPALFARADDEGRYRLAAPTADRFWIQAEAAGHLPRAARVVPATAGLQEIPLLELTRAAVLHGRVVDPYGEAVGDALVEAVRPRGAVRREYFKPDRADGLARSGRDGRYAMEPLHPGTRYLIRASRPGFAPAEVSVATARTISAQASFDVVLRPIRAARGTVVDPEGLPVAGATVVLTSSGERAPKHGAEDPWRALTDERGRFATADTPAAAVDLAVTRRGFAPLRRRGVELPRHRGDVDLGILVLERGATLSGRVAAPGGAAVGGARIHVFPDADRPIRADGAWRQRRDPEAEAGPDGRFEVANLPPGEPLVLVADHPDFSPARLSGVEAPAREPLAVVLEPAVKVSGRVLDTEDRPVAGAEVHLLWRRSLDVAGRRVELGRRHSRQAASDGEGRFVVAGAPPGAAEVVVRAAGFVPPEPRQVEVLPGGVQGLTFVLERGAAVEGRTATESGVPVAGARVVAGPAETRSDGRGRYRLEGVVPGPAGIEAVHRDYARLVRTLDVEPGVNRLDLTFEDGREVTGRVVDARGAPVVGALVALTGDAPRERHEHVDWTAVDGSFVLRPVARGRYRIRASREGFAPAEPEGSVTVAEGPVEGLEVVLEKGMSITGRILGLDAGDLFRVTIMAERDGVEPRTDRVDAEGRYEIADLDAGDWRVRATLDGGRRQTQGRVSLVPGDGGANLDLELRDALTLSGRVLHDGEPLADAFISLAGHDLAVERSQTTDYLGEFTLRDLEPGRYRFGLTSEREHLVHNQTIELDGDRQLLLRLGTAAVGGTVVEAAGSRGVAGAAVVLRRLVDAPGVQEFVVAGGTGGDGSFFLPRVPPGRYRMTGRKDGFAPSERELEVVAARDLSDLEIPLTPTPGLDLAVRLASGGVPPIVHVRLIDGAGRAVVEGSRAVDREGRTRLATAPPGAWELVTSASGGAVTRTPVTVPGEPVFVVLPDAGRLRVRVPALGTSDVVARLRVRSADHRPLVAMDSWGSFRDEWLLSAGTTTLEGVPPGVWTLEVVTPDGQTWRGSAVTDGRDAEVRVD